MSDLDRMCVLTVSSSGKVVGKLYFFASRPQHPILSSLPSGRVVGTKEWGVVFLSQVGAAGSYPPPGPRRAGGTDKRQYNYKLETETRLGHWYWKTQDPEPIDKDQKVGEIEFARIELNQDARNPYTDPILSSKPSSVPEQKEALENAQKLRAEDIWELEMEEVQVPNDLDYPDTKILTVEVGVGHPFLL